MTTTTPYINFDGNTREAMNFYKNCLDAALEISLISEAPFAAQMPPEKQNHVLHAILSKNGNVLLLGSDMVTGSDLQQGNNLSIMMNCDTEQDIHQFFSQLSEGGAVRDELGIKFWGGMFGAITDKFGVNWSFHFDPNIPQ